MIRRGLGIAVALAVALVGGCSDTRDDGGAEPDSAASSGEGLDDPAYDVALSEPREDSVYPDVGAPGVDALHYDLALDWDPTTDTLTGEQTLAFRATETAQDLTLDFGAPLEVESLSLDGDETSYEHRGKALVIEAPVEADERYELVITYAGTPEPVEAPTNRGDFDSVGFTITDDHETWTMQEPFGAYTWYAVNDHPSDKALYDFTLTVPSPWTGLANGELTARDVGEETTTTQWHLAEPAASYLTTVAFGDYELTEDESASGVPISLWIPRGRPRLAEGPSTAAAAIDYLEEVLGPYPFDTFGILVVDSQSGMETQTMVTLGDTRYTTSPAVVLHELVHQWYGDQVTPNDWRDLWMNEGMAMYLQLRWEAEQQGIPLNRAMRSYRPLERQERAANGPPADYDPETFGASNVYFGPALMWHALQQRIGEEAFLETVRAWPQARDNGNSGRDDYLAWLEEQTGEELTDFFDAWLLGEQTPRTSPAAR